MKCIQKDLTGTICPMPVINTIKLFNQLSSGDTLEVLIDDPLAVKSIPEELNDFDVKIKVTKGNSHWKIFLKKG